MIIKNVCCMDIRASDGAQRFDSLDPATPEYLRTIWLLGINRAKGVTVGSCGRLVFLKTANSGLYVFEPAENL